MKTYEEFTGTIDVDGVEFTYWGHHRDWDPWPGFTPPPGTVWEVYVENLPYIQQWASGFAGTKEDALCKLKAMIRRIRDYKS